MSDSVGSYAVSTFTTPTSGAQVSSATLRGNFNTLGVAHSNHDADPSLHWQTVSAASLPSAGSGSKAKYVTSDTRRVYLDLTNAGALSEIAYLPLSGGTVAGTVVIGTDPTGTETLRIGGPVFANGYVKFGAGALGTAGAVHTHPSYGLVVSGKPGTNGELLLTNSGGSNSIQVMSDGTVLLGYPDTGGSEKLRVNGDLRAGAAVLTTAAGSGVLSLWATGDTVSRVMVTNSATPTVSFGPGGATAHDTTISRAAAGTIRVGTALVVGASDPGGAESLRVNGAVRASDLVLTAATVTTIAPSGGSAAPLPPQPVGYLRLLLNGTNYFVPYFG